MKDDKLFRAMGNIDDELIDRAGIVALQPRAVTRAAVFRWAVPVAACLIIVFAIAVPALLKQLPTGNGYFPDENSANAGYVSMGATASGENVPDEKSGGSDGTAEGSAVGDGEVPPPSLSLENDSGSEMHSYQSYPEQWHGLPTEDFVLGEKADDIAADRMVFKTLEDLVAYADLFVAVPKVHETAQEDYNMQTSIAEYFFHTIGGRLNTSQWDDQSIPCTGSRVLIRQQLMGGCTMDEPNNLLRKNGTYLLPIKYNPDWGAYEVVGDMDVLFELNNAAEIVSHSQWEGFNQYDGKPINDLIDDIRALYQELHVEFIEQPINTVEQATEQVTTAYLYAGYRKFSVEFDSETVIRDVDAYVFKISFGESGWVHAAVAKGSGGVIFGTLQEDGEMEIHGGMGSFY